MNKERVLMVADAIEQHTIPWLGFNMTGFMSIRDDYDDEEWEDTKIDHTSHDCGAVACIAGWSVALEYPDANPNSSAFTFAADHAKPWLDLDMEQTINLFYAANHPEFSAASKWHNITAEQAVRTLRHLAETGVVDWTV